MVVRVNDTNSILYFNKQDIECMALSIKDKKSVLYYNNLDTEYAVGRVNDTNSILHCNKQDIEYMAHITNEPVLTCSLRHTWYKPH